MLEAKHIVRLFTRMTHLYGHKWFSIYGEAMKGAELSVSAKQWLYDLREFSPEQIAIGMQAVERTRLEWPPGPLDFMSLCEGIPSIAEVLDRNNDYGPVCKAIRARMDWYNLEAMATPRMIKAATEARERAITAIRRDGTLLKIVGQSRKEIGVTDAV